MSGAIPADTLLGGLASLGVRLVTAVPCGYFAGPLRLLESGDAHGLRYVPAVNEGAAAALAAGSQLAGAPAAVFAQNSGFGNMINPLTSLVLPYRLPMVVLMSMRGWPTPGPGEQQHHWMGRVVPDWLASLEVPHWMLGAGASLAELLGPIRQALAERRPAFLLAARGAIAGATGSAPVTQQHRPTRAELVAALLAEVTDQHILSTTGYLSRELYGLGDQDRNFYMQGSMGHAASVALGAAMAEPERRFVILDGDGSVLMHMGSLATIGHVLPGNLTHIVFDNGSYESTGGQRTAADHTDLAGVGKACGYRDAASVRSAAELRPALRKALRSTGPVIVVVSGATSAAPGVRASEDLSPQMIADRFSASITARPVAATPVRDGPGWPDETFPSARAVPAQAPRAEERGTAAVPLAGLARLPGHPAAYFGQGAAGCLGDLLAEMAASRVLVVHGRKSFVSCGAAAVFDALRHRFTIGHFAGARPNPTLEVLQEGLAAARAFAPDVVAGVGGGSAMDVAKCIAVLAPQTADPLTCLRDPGAIARPRPGLILVPTTCGSGSELTKFATIYVGHQKFSLDADQAWADTVLVDPRLSATVPVPVAVAAAADAVCQAVESYWAVASTADSRRLAMQALATLVPATAVAAGGAAFADPSVNDDLALGAALSGAAINVTRTTAAHALSYALTARRGIPHGIAVALHLSWLIGHNARAGAGDTRHPGGPGAVRALVADVQRICADQAGRPLETLLKQLLALGGYPPGLAGLGLDPGHWLGVWEEALTSVRAGNNPRIVTRADLRQALDRRGTSGNA